MTKTSLHQIERAIMWPFKMVDLTGPDGRLSFSKNMALAIFLMTAWVCIQRGMLPPLGIVIALLAAAFGRFMFGKLLDSKTVTASEHSEIRLDVAKVAEVLKKRDPDTGIDPA